MPTDLQKARELFLHAVGKLPPEQWEGYVAKASGGDADLAHQVECLLQVHREAGSFLNAPAAGLQGPETSTAMYPDLAEGPGAVIGPYKLLQQIGEGGMGVVFMAEQSEPIRRKVAVKVIKPGMDTRQVIARFEAERQALAMMDHVNIARVLDAGTTESGRPYFVMELVHGVPITAYCDDNHLTPRERLKLFVPICQAIQHAHQKGIIHRDIKPSNVMVTLYDGQPVPKVIDFGVAKATEQRLTERTLFTRYGTIVGTLEYMSPEQAEKSALGADTRSDIYSLGVLVYELLTGSTPFGRKRLNDAAFDEMLRIIREEEPPKPSTRLSTTDQLPSIAANRGLDPLKLNRLVRGELDWIVMKALEKDRSRRYETASAFADDIERHLRDEPVEARAASQTYRLKKFIHRNKTGVLAGSVAVLALALGLILSSIGFVHARRQAIRADEAAARATATSDFLQQMLQSADPDQSKGQEYSVRQLLDDFSAGLKDQFASQPEVEADVQKTMGLAYRRLDKRKSEQHLRLALDLRRQLVGDQHEEFANSLVDYAAALLEQAHVVDAENHLRRALAIYQKQGTRGRPVIRALQILQIVLQAGGRLSEIEPIVDQAVAIANQSPAEQFPEIANIYHGLINAKIAESKYAEAEALGRQCVEMHLRLHGQNHPETGWGYYNLACALSARRKTDEAIDAFYQAAEVFRRALPRGQAANAATLEGITGVLVFVGKSDRLVKLFGSPRKLNKLETFYRESLPASIDLSDGGPYSVATSVQDGLSLLADIHSKLEAQFAAAGNTERAESSAASAQALREELILLDLKLEQVSKQAKERGRQLLESDSADPFVLSRCAWILSAASNAAHRDPILAVRLAAKAVRLSPRSSFIWNTFGVAQYRAGEWQGAVEAIEKAMELNAGGDGFDWFFLAMAHWQLGDKVEARQWYDRAVEWMEKQPTQDEELRRFHEEAEGLIKVTDEKPTTKPQSK